MIMCPLEPRVNRDGISKLDLRHPVVAFTEGHLSAFQVLEFASARIRGTGGKNQNSHHDQTQLCDQHNPLRPVHRVSPMTILGTHTRSKEMRSARSEKVGLAGLLPVDLCTLS